MHGSSLKCIEHKFLIPGHTEMEVDSMHSSIEHAKKVTKIYVPNDWFNVIALARRNHPYHIISLGYSDFTDFKILQKMINNTKVDVAGNQVRWSKVCAVNSTVDEPEYISIKYDFDEEYQSVHLCRQTTTRKSKTTKKKKVDITNLGVKQARKYMTPICISEEKRADLIRLCRIGIIPEMYKDFYENIQSNSTVVDRLAMPDIMEESEDED